MEEDTQQRITYLLQEIDANICAAHRSATQICSTVRRHHQILRQIHDATQAWKPLFESFSHQPVVRRPPPTPAAASVRAQLTPSSRAATKSRRSRASSHGNEQGEYEGDEDDEDTYTRELDERNDYDNDDDDDDDSLVVGEQLFKTTTLVEHTERSVNDSFNVSIASDNLPQMARTPYMPTPAYHNQGDAGHDASSINTEERSNWSPAMSSPMRTGVLKSNQRRAGGRIIPTPDSAISSVAPTSPISKNLMKMGAFEFTPPRGGKTSRQWANPQQQQGQQEQTGTPMTPEIPTFATRDTLAPQSPAVPLRDDAAPHETPSTRKRKRVGDSAVKSSTAYPKTHYPVNPVTAASPGLNSPSWRSPGKPFANLRRKYSTGGDYLTPTKFREVESRASIEASAARASQNLLVDDEPVTPPLDLASPLLRTQLKAMTPHTPLSNRLVGATLDIGSMSQESKLQDYDDSFNAGEPAPQFEIALFPAAFQRGVGAVQISTLYSKFQGLDNASLPTFSVDQLAEKLPDYGKEKIEVLLDTLVSRRLLRPFVVEGTMFWQIPA